MKFEIGMDDAAALAHMMDRLGIPEDDRPKSPAPNGVAGLIRAQSALIFALVQKIEALEAAAKK